jgi:hypothetical protein
VTAPSGQEVSLTPEEERDVVKKAISEKIVMNMTLPSDIRRSAISALGTALGLALGGLVVGLVFGRRR